MSNKVLVTDVHGLLGVAAIRSNNVTYVAA
jgi:hypothetical protein